MKVGDMVKIFAASQQPPAIIVEEDVPGYWFVLWNNEVIILAENILEVINGN